MADESPNDEGSEFLRKLRRIVREEVQDAISNLGRTLRDEMHALRDSRVADTAEALHQALDIKPDDEPVLIDVVHNAIRSRRNREAQWANFRSAVAGSAWEIFKHALSVGVLAVAGWLAAMKWGWWPH